MRSSFRCPRFVVDESPRTLKVPMMKFEGGASEVVMTPMHSYAGPCVA